MAQLAEEIAHAVRASRVVLDGEICCLERNGRSHFNNLLFRREWPHFYAFDILSLEGKDLTTLPLLQRKRILRDILPKIECRLLYIDPEQPVLRVDITAHASVHGVRATVFHEMIHAAVVIGPRAAVLGGNGAAAQGGGADPGLGFLRWGSRVRISTLFRSAFDGAGRCSAPSSRACSHHQGASRL